MGLGSLLLWAGCSALWDKPILSGALQSPSAEF